MDNQSPELPPLAPQNQLNQEMVSPVQQSYGEAQSSRALETNSQGPVAQNPQPAVMPNPQPGSPHQSQPTHDPSLYTQHGNPAIADDADLIEKEWIVKAKSIVEHTRGDPYTRNREMNKVKVDYLKKRYNKDIKITE